MATHFMVISYTREMQNIFENLNPGLPEDTPPGRQQAPRPLRFKSARCQNWSNLPTLVLNAGSRLVLLDLVGHGSSKDFELGDNTFLQSDTEPSADIMNKLNALLPDNARIRLLGCQTGVGESGHRMITNLSNALKKREVLGTTVDLFPGDFNASGLKEAFASKWLYSSKEDKPTRAGDRKVSGTVEKTMADVWQKNLPGYQVVGRGEPITSIDLNLRYQGKSISFSPDRRLVLVKDTVHAPPLMLRWSDTEPVPSTEKLLTFFR